MDVRDEKQNKLVDLYLNSNLQKCSIVSGTGTGKSFIVMKIIKKLNPGRVIILVNSKQLKDENWEKEFQKFGMSEFFKNKVVMQTYQYMYKQEPNVHGHREDDFVVMDEVDFIANTEELHRTIEVFPDSRVLGVTGYITDDKQSWFKHNLPVIHEFTASEAQDSGLLNQLKFIFVKYDLSRDPKSHKVETKTKSFYQSENNAYDYLNKKVEDLLDKKKMLEAAVSAGTIQWEQYMQESVKLDKSITYNINQRANFLYNCKTTADMAKALKEYFLQEDPNNKIVIFSNRTKQSEYICGKNVYNGTNTEKQNSRIFDKFNSGEIKELCVCTKINRGANIERLTHGILETYTGSDTSGVQRFGRLLRLNPDETAVAVVLLPYYITKVGENNFEPAETQQIVWATKMLKGQKIKTHEVWDYRTIKKDFRK